MRNFTHRWSQSRHFPPKLGIFFQFSKKGRGELLPPLLLVTRLDNNVKALFSIWANTIQIQYHIGYNTGTISSYLDDIYKEEISASKRQIHSPIVCCIFGYCWNMLTEIDCLCCDEVNFVAGITNESKISD